MLNPKIDTSNWKSLPDVAPGVARWTINKQKIPPGYTDVKINLDKSSYHEMVGKNKKGKWVYIRSKKHEDKSTSTKFKRVLAFGKVYPKLQKRIDKDADKIEEAAVLRLIDKTAFRIGSEADTGAEKKAYGASTLHREHVKVKGSEIKFDFGSKRSGHMVKVVSDRELAADIKRRILRGGKLFDTTDGKVRNYLRSIPYGDGFKVHDFRTFIATSVAIDMIKGMPKPKNKSEYKKFRNEVGDKVAEVLGDTRTVALGSYIAPDVFGVWEKWV